MGREGGREEIGHEKYGEIMTRKMTKLHLKLALLQIWANAQMPFDPSGYLPKIRWELSLEVDFVM